MVRYILQRKAETHVFAPAPFQVSPVAMSIGKTLVTVILAAHLLSCLWFWVSCLDSLSEVRTLRVDVYLISGTCDWPY